MTNKELEKKIEELSAQIEALKGELKEEKPKGEIWKPKEDEMYWWINECGEVDFCTYKDNDVEKVGNCYPTEEKAQFEAQREKYTRLFRQYVEQHNGYNLNWKHADPSKWYVYYNWEKEEIYYDNCYQEQGMGVYGTSKQVMQDAVEFVGRENFLRYVIGVEE